MCRLGAFWPGSYLGYLYEGRRMALGRLLFEAAMRFKRHAIVCMSYMSKYTVERWCVYILELLNKLLNTTH
jgi:hypothetical protein